MLLYWTDLHAWLGGKRVIHKHGLMLLPSWAFGEQGRPAIGFPVYDLGQPINVIRRYIDGKDPRYKGLLGRGHGLWPDRARMPRSVVLVAGTRDACFVRAARIPAYTTTGGVATWPDIASWARRRTFTLAFDADEQGAAQRLRKRLVKEGAKSVMVMPPPKGIKDMAELGERRGLEAIKTTIKRVLRPSGPCVLTRYQGV